MRRTVTFAYIASTSYCGSTLLSFLLNAQPGVVSVGEVAWSIPLNPGEYRCSCGMTMSACPFWRRIEVEMRNRGHVFSPDNWGMAFQGSPNVYVNNLITRSLRSDFMDKTRDALVRAIPQLRKRLRTIGERNAALVCSIASVSNASVFVDASKDPARVWLLETYSNLRPRVIHLVRDSPAVVNSYVKKNQDPDAFWKAIRWWNSTARHLEQIRRRLPSSDWLLVRYEDLAENPRAVIRRIVRFLDAEARDQVLEFRHTDHHIIGNTMRLSNTTDIRFDRSWQHELSPGQISMIINATQAYRKRFGYDSR
jgi:hypothetical protein